MSTLLCNRFSICVSSTVPAVERSFQTDQDGHDLPAILSHVEPQIVKTDTFQFEDQQSVIERTGLRGAAL